MRAGYASRHRRAFAWASVANDLPVLAALTGISQATISAIENGRVNLGVERAKVMARALKRHPAVVVFPGWEVGLESAA